MTELDTTDRCLINRLQTGIDTSARPFAAIALELGIGEEDVVARLRRLLDSGVLSRFGPMYHAEQLGGALTLAAMAVPPDQFDAVAAQVNAFPEVAHNYARDHRLNMWFVLATERPERVAEVLAEIESATGLEVFNMPKEHEFYVGLKFSL